MNSLVAMPAVIAKFAYCPSVLAALKDLIRSLEDNPLIAVRAIFAGRIGLRFSIPETC